MTQSTQSNLTSACTGTVAKSIAVAAVTLSVFGAARASAGHLKCLVMTVNTNNYYARELYVLREGRQWQRKATGFITYACVVHPPDRPDGVVYHVESVDNQYGARVYRNFVALPDREGYWFDLREDTPRFTCTGFSPMFLKQGHSVRRRHYISFELTDWDDFDARLDRSDMAFKFKLDSGRVEEQTAWTYQHLQATDASCLTGARCIGSSYNQDRALLQANNQTLVFHDEEGPTPHRFLRTTARNLQGDFYTVVLVRNCLGWPAGGNIDFLVYQHSTNPSFDLDLVQRSNNLHLGPNREWECTSLTWDGEFIQAGLIKRNDDGTCETRFAWMFLGAVEHEGAYIPAFDKARLTGTEIPAGVTGDYKEEGCGEGNIVLFSDNVASYGPISQPKKGK